VFDNLVLQLNSVYSFFVMFVISYVILLSCVLFWKCWDTTIMEVFFIGVEFSFYQSLF
jgi:hypothetical protein